MHPPRRGLLSRDASPGFRSAASVFFHLHPHYHSTGSGVTAAAAGGTDAVYDCGDEESTPPINPFYWNKRIHLLCSGRESGGCGHGVDEALRLLDRLRFRGHRPDSLVLNHIVHGLCDAGRFLEAHNRLLLSVASGWVPDDRTSNVLVARLLDAHSPDMTLRVLEHLISTKPAFIPSSTIYNRLINQFCMLSRPADARNVFLDMKSRGHHPNIVSYTTLINGFGRVGGLDVARQLFEEMLASGILPNSLTYSVLLKGVLRKRMVEEGRRMTNELWVRMASEEDSSMKNAAFANLIDALCREGFFHELFKLAEEMPPERCVNEEFAYGQMIDSLCRVGRHHMASRIVYMMRKRGLTPSVVSYNCIVHGLSKEGEGGCMRAYQLFKEGMEFGYMPPESTYQSLVEGLCRVKDVQKARDVTDFKLRREGVATTRIYNIFLYALRLVDNPSEQLNVLVSMFQNQCRPDVVTLNTIIYSFCRIGKVDEALKILNDMLQGKFCTPDVVTFTTILHGLLDVGRIKEALDIFHRKMPECSCSPSTVTYNAVLHGLCKLRSVEKAVSIFHEMVQKSVSADSRTYTVILEGLLSAAQVHEAKTFWEDVVWPSSIHDDFVYATVLRGLCNLGRLDEACDFLYELIDCGISPGIVNYNILIDGACKMSLKREAYQVVAEMRKNGLIPDSVTWRILDKLHKGKKIGDTPRVHPLVFENFSQQEVTTTAGMPTGDNEASQEKEDDSDKDRKGVAAESNIDMNCSISSNEENNKYGNREASEIILFTDENETKESKLRKPLSRIVQRVFGLM